METPSRDETPTPTDESRERVKYLLRYVWRGNQREMARAIGVTQGLLSKVVNGHQAPGPKLIDALAGHPEVNADWVRNGAGEPTYAPQDGSLPTAAGVLPGPPLRHPHLLTGARHPVARSLDRDTRYWLSLSPTSPLLREPALRLAAGDLLLVEADPEWTGRPDMTDGRLCGVRFLALPEPTYELGLVSSSQGEAIVKLVGGAFAPPPPALTTRPKPPEDRNLRRKVLDLEGEEAKAIKREQLKSEAKQAAAEGLPIAQADIVAVQVYMVRPDLCPVERRG